MGFENSGKGEYQTVRSCLERLMNNRQNRYIVRSYCQKEIPGVDWCYKVGDSRESLTGPMKLIVLTIPPSEIIPEELDKQLLRQFYYLSHEPCKVEERILWPSQWDRKAILGK